MTSIAQKYLNIAREAQVISNDTIQSKIRNSREADKFVIRYPDGMREEVHNASVDQYISMNTFVIQAIAEKLDRQKRQDLLLDALAQAVASAQKRPGHSEGQA
ncbi:hypothetical protein PSCICO_15270 [Pseudomonas cichorii]|uniref:Arc family DNA-binding protein n=1 Tax=Pseudomonas cichorii TaxID=36746 RepID=UPI0019101B97|nr:Arc family DNA-binding protein [Pseudomonas cichorii]GFM86128.1 hypothetical protein PSCICO_15270 [Pseudomonas cichorii]